MSCCVDLMWLVCVVMVAWYYMPLCRIDFSLLSRYIYVILTIIIFLFHVSSIDGYIIVDYPFLIIKYIFSTHPCWYWYIWVHVMLVVSSSHCPIVIKYYFYRGLRKSALSVPQFFFTCLLQNRNKERELFWSPKLSIPISPVQLKSALK